MVTAAGHHPGTRAAAVLAVTAALLAAGPGAAAGTVPGPGTTLGPAAVPAPPAGAGDRRAVDGARQVIVVSAASWRSTRGTLTAFQWTGSAWQQVVPASPAWLGAGGLVPAASRRQGSGQTPAGTFALPWAFGRLDDPGTAMSYRRFDRDDAWPYDPRDPSTYNVFQHRGTAGHWRAGFVERLWRLRDQYRYAVVLDFNLPPQPYRIDQDGVRRALVPANTHRGGGIFLHVDDGRPTAGCIGIALDRMRTILRWLDPAQQPLIVIGPHATLAGG